MSKKVTPSKTKSPGAKEKKDTQSPSKSPSVKTSSDSKQSLNWIVSSFEGLATKNQLELSPVYLYSAFGGARCQLSVASFQLLNIKIGDLVLVYFKVIRYMKMAKLRHPKSTSSKMKES